MSRRWSAIVGALVLCAGVYLQFGERVSDDVAKQLTGAQSGSCWCANYYNGSIDGCDKTAGLWTCGPVISDNFGWGWCSSTTSVICGTGCSSISQRSGCT